MGPHCGQSEGLLSYSLFRAISSLLMASRLLCQSMTWMDCLEFFQSRSCVIMMAAISSICQGPLIHVVTAVQGGKGGFITNKTLKPLYLKPNIIYMQFHPSSSHLSVCDLSCCPFLFSEAFILL